MTPEMLSLAEQVAARAESLFRHRSLLCAESILVACNEVFHGGLEHGQAVGLAAGMGEGLGDSGCLCGALNGRGCFPWGSSCPAINPTRTGS